MNVIVEFELQDDRERELFAELVEEIETWRGLTAVERYERMNPEPKHRPIPDEYPPFVKLPDPAVPQTPPITDAELEAQITSYWKAKGLPAAKEVLARFGVERVGAIPANRRGEAMLAMATG